jgi:predicted PhzF superfamily epimerase YddE/YHI9
VFTNIPLSGNWLTVEDVVTRSLAGPPGAYLVKYGFKEGNKILQLNQGKTLGRSSHVNTIYHHAIPSAVVNVIWVFLAILAMFKMKV